VPHSDAGRPKSRCHSLGADLVGLDEVERDHLTLAHVVDAREAQRGQRVADRLALRIEHARFERDVDARFHISIPVDFLGGCFTPLRAQRGAIGIAPGVDTFGNAHAAQLRAGRYANQLVSVVRACGAGRSWVTTGAAGQVSGGAGEVPLRIGAISSPTSNCPAGRARRGAQKYGRPETAPTEPGMPRWGARGSPEGPSQRLLAPIALRTLGGERIRAQVSGFVARNRLPQSAGSAR
jgi:hypothetical protein